jgi:nucleotide-binding universal stress UspA family protein
MLKKILLPLENSPYTNSALDYACFVARRQDAVVTGGIFLDVEKTNQPLGKIDENLKITWNKEVNPNAIADAKPTIEYLIHLLTNKCKSQNVKFSFEEEIGMPSSHITSISKYYDLIVTGLKSDFGLIKKNFGHSFLLKIIGTFATPVLAVPQSYRQTKNIIVAYDASLIAARALQRFIHTANFSDQNITLVCSSKDARQGEENLKRGKEYLISYGAKRVETDLSRLDIKKVLKTSYFDYADLIVLGVHSKNILKDIFGKNLTRQLVVESNKALFMGI